MFTTWEYFSSHLHCWWQVIQREVFLSRASTVTPAKMWKRMLSVVDTSWLCLLRWLYSTTGSGGICSWRSTLGKEWKGSSSVKPTVWRNGKYANVRMQAHICLLYNLTQTMWYSIAWLSSLPWALLAISVRSMFVLCRGDSFRSVLLRIGKIRSLIPGGVHILAMTATATYKDNADCSCANPWYEKHTHRGYSTMQEESCLCSRTVYVNYWDLYASVGSDQERTCFNASCNSVL